MEGSGSFHGSTWKFPPSVEVEASITSINCSFHGYFRESFHELPYIYPYILIYTSTSITNLQLTTPNPNPDLELRLWKLAHFQLPWKYMEVHGSSLLLTWKLELLARKLAYLRLQWKLVEASMEVDIRIVDGTFHGSR